MFLQAIINYFLEYLCFFIGAAIQLIFIALPIVLKNWDDDALNALTYVSFQLFISSIIFIIAPWIFDVKTTTPWAQMFFIFGTGFIALFRILKIIPLEFTYPIKLPVIVVNNPKFNEFNTNERQKLLLKLDFQEADAQLRYNALREKLIRLKFDKGSSFDDLLIEDE